MAKARALPVQIEIDEANVLVLLKHAPSLSKKPARGLCPLCGTYLFYPTDLET